MVRLNKTIIKIIKEPTKLFIKNVKTLLTTYLKSQYPKDIII